MIPEVREQLRRHLLAEEGMILYAYPDHLGYTTIGVGHLIDRRKGGGITRTQALAILDADIDRVSYDVAERFPQFLQLDPARQIAVIALAFQLGVGGLAGFRQMLSALWRRDYDGAAVSMLDSKWARQTPARAHRLSEVIRTGRWPDEPLKA